MANKHAVTANIMARLANKSGGTANKRVNSANIPVVTANITAYSADSTHYKPKINLKSPPKQVIFKKSSIKVTSIKGLTNKMQFSAKTQRLVYKI